MSYPPPPGLTSSSNSAQHPSLPARPPPSAVGQNANSKPSNGSGFKPAFNFAPRAVSGSQNARTNSAAQYASVPTPSYNATPMTYPQPPQQSYNPQPQPPSYDPSQSNPQIRNPFVPTSASGADAGYPPAYDPEYEAQIASWQSAYVSKDGEKARPAGLSASAAAAVAAQPRVDSPASKSNDNPKTVQRSGGGTTWSDTSLLEWDPAHFRIFVGNLAGEVTDDSLLKAFSKFGSVQKARVVRDKRTTKSKGYGFVSFSDGDDYFRAAREMQGKYIGSHPVLIKRAMTEVKPSTVKDNRRGKRGYGGGSEKTEHGGVKKNKKDETRNGMRILG